MKKNKKQIINRETNHKMCTLHFENVQTVHLTRTKINCGIILALGRMTHGSIEQTSYHQNWKMVHLYRDVGREVKIIEYITSKCPKSSFFIQF